MEKGKGQECYDWYHYLWHLIAIGAVRRRKAKNVRLPESVAYILEADAWKDLNSENPGEGEIVAQIDTGVNDNHPNLAPRIIGKSVNFAGHPFGVQYGEPNEDQLGRGPEPCLDGSLISPDTWEEAERLAEGTPALAVIKRLRSGRGVTQQIAQTSRLRYSAHGTACAGLIVGAPATSPKPKTLDDGDGPIPYWGVAPGARLLPIEISARPDAQQLIMAFLYAWDQKKVSVIHFPREVPDPWRSHKYYRGKFEDSRYTSKGAEALWEYFAKLFERVSEEIPIVCAAGNNGYNQLIYPASKATEHNGVIAVGAITYLAKRSAYSNYSGNTDNALTIAAPSDDEEVYTRYQIRLDREAARWRDHNFDIYKDIDQVDFAPQGVLTVDIPGRHGYSGGQLLGNQPPDVENRDRASLYTVFGGTSAASAIVAGAVALLQSQGRLSGGEVKARLKQAGAKTVSWPWLTEGKILTDAMNGEKGRIEFARQFGAGVLDLRKLLRVEAKKSGVGRERVLEPQS